MKINELTGYKNDPHYQKAVEIFKNYRLTVGQKLEAFSTYIQEQGFKQLGKPGVSGMAFEHPTYPWVFKIFTDDNGYLHYFNYAKNNQHNPHVPKVKGNPLPITSDSFMGNTYLVRIEKLQEMPHNLKMNPLIGIITSIDSKEDLTPEVKTTLKKAFPEIIDVLEDIVNSGFSVDLHHGNLMIRKNTIVITDPLLG
jgi:hypothetical protein